MSPDFLADLRHVVGQCVQKQHLAEIVEKTGHVEIFRRQTVCKTLGRDRSDVDGVGLNVLQLGCPWTGHGGLEDFGRQGELTDLSQSEVVDGVLDACDAPGDAHESRIDDLQDLDADARVLAHDPGDVFGGDVVVLERERELLVDARLHGQTVDPADGVPDGGVVINSSRAQARSIAFSRIPSSQGLDRN